jgi:hypothetical protein
MSVTLSDGNVYEKFKNTDKLLCAAIDKVDEYLAGVTEENVGAFAIDNTCATL